MKSVVFMEGSVVEQQLRLFDNFLEGTGFLCPSFFLEGTGWKDGFLLRLSFWKVRAGKVIYSYRS